MHLDEEVKPVAQKPLVLNRGHAVEPLEEEFLLLGGRWKHALRLKGYRALRQAQRAIGPRGPVDRLGPTATVGAETPLPLPLPLWVRVDGGPRRAVGGWVGSGEGSG